MSAKLKIPFISVALAIFVLCAPTASGAPSRISELNRALLGDLKRQILGWARTCHGMMNYGEGCEQGDLQLFAGLLCLSGEESRCEDVRRSQDPEGRWWRSPSRSGHDEHDAFSRDQSLGVLAYLASRSDWRAAIRWVYWIETHGFKVCTVDDPYETCLILPPFWGLIGRVWQAMGLEPDFLMNLGMRENLDEKVLLAETALTALPFLGEDPHLNAVNILIHQYLGRTSPEIVKAARFLSVSQPANSFFRFLAEGPNDEIARMVLVQCPAQPQVAHPGGWTWMANPSRVEQSRDSMGWDCVFMLNLLLNEDLQHRLGF